MYLSFFSCLFIYLSLTVYVSIYFSLTVYVFIYLSILINLEGWTSENEIVRAVTRSGFSRFSRFSRLSRFPRLYSVRYAKCKLNIFWHFTIFFLRVSSVFFFNFPVSLSCFKVSWEIFSRVCYYYLYYNLFCFIITLLLFNSWSLTILYTIP